jgi:uncharacterized protein
VRKRIGLFFKTSRAGAVKTRLCPPLSPVQAALLYDALLEDAVSHARGVAGVTTVLFRSGEPGDPVPAALQGLELRMQAGSDLGARMHRAFEDLLEPGVGGAVLLGSDAPTLPPKLIEEAFRRLEHHDLVLGPAEDGGYYLIALTRPERSLFQRMEWSGPRVLSQTLQKAAAARLKTALLDPWYDVDTSEDLARLVQELRDEKSAIRAPATRKMLDRLGLLRG